MYAALGALIGAAVLLTAAAFRASGWQRLPWSVTALLTWSFTMRLITVGVLVTTVVRTAEGAPPQPQFRTT